MKTHAIKKENVPYTIEAFGEWFDYGDIPCVKKMSLVLNVSDLKMGLNDGSVLSVGFERYIDDVFAGSSSFATVGLDSNGEITKVNQPVVLHAGDKDANGDELVFGNRGRFVYSLSQASINTPKAIPSIASFEAGIVIE